ncbi:carbohydrate kinase family protein [Candidatus Saccharibacteria bacterium]|nr:carbohydrate kinase family protein [Candidatus Saccharibacteria bacterium]
MARIISLGSAVEDIFLIDRDDFVASQIGDTSIFGKIEIGSKIDIDKISYEIGGGGTNSAVTFSRFGHESIFLGNLANDPAGEAIVALLDKEGIDSSYIKTIKGTTGCSVILLDAKSGERTILTHRGVSSNFKNQNPEILNEIKPDWLYISSLRGDMDTLLSFIESAKNNNCRIMLNPGKLELSHLEQILGILSDIDVLLLNKSEASQIVPGKILSELISHLSNYTETVILTDGPMGGIATNREETYRFGIYEDVKVKDTTGAGDAFGSGFLASLASGKSFRQAIKYGSANSTSVIRYIGAKKGILTGNEKLHEMPIQKVDL